LGKRKTRKQAILDFYFKRPIITDMVVIVFVLSINYFIQKRFDTVLWFTFDALSSVLNECISSSMSLGGFVLAAMAIVASIKQDVPVVKVGKARSPKEYFFNTKGYALLMKSFTGACIIYSVSFLYFSTVRSFAESFQLTTLFNLTFFGLILSLTTLIRCIWLIQAIIHITGVIPKVEEEEPTDLGIED